ncbi:MAG: hypothetical protein ACRCZG_00060, partial [Culicoidibacterales bacterium]
MKYEPILKEYALYRDNKLLAFGTAKRIAEQLGMQEKHIHTLASDAYKKTVSEGSMQAFLLEEDDYSTLEG